MMMKRFINFVFPGDIINLVVDDISRISDESIFKQIYSCNNTLSISVSKVFYHNYSNDNIVNDKIVVSLNYHELDFSEKVYGAFLDIYFTKDRKPEVTFLLSGLKQDRLKVDKIEIRSINSKYKNNHEFYCKDICPIRKLRKCSGLDKGCDYYNLTKDDKSKILLGDIVEFKSISLEGQEPKYTYDGIVLGMWEECEKVHLGIYYNKDNLSGNRDKIRQVIRNYSMNYCFDVIRTLEEVKLKIRSGSCFSSNLCDYCILDCEKDNNISCDFKSQKDLLSSLNINVIDESLRK